MKKPLLLIVLLLTIVSPWKKTAGQDNHLQPLNYFNQENYSSKNNNAGPGESLYHTHPEFSGIITTTVTVPAQNTDEGYIFVAPFPGDNSEPTAVMILENDGQPIYIKTLPSDKFGGDFKKQTVAGVDYLTYHSGILPSGYTYGVSYVMNNKYELLDIWTMDVGGGSDVHDFLLLDNGNAILMAYVPIPFDLRPYGGPENGTLIDIILQEQDPDKNVVFEWQASEHMPIEDTEVDLNTTTPVDFLHTNAIAVDSDGNWLLSHRHFSEITKIDRQTGDIIWRMGGAGNEFTFLNDIGFFNQHDVNRLDNGHIMLFDNGNQHNPPFSRAVEYAIDEVAKTVSLVRAYPDDMLVYSSAMGNVQLLPNGNWFIGWGTLPMFSEVRPDGETALETVMSRVNYRAYRFPWSATPAANPRTVVTYDGDPTAVNLYTSWNGATDITGYQIFAGATSDSMGLIQTVPRSGFETGLLLKDLPADTCFFQTKPIHAQGNATPFSNLTYRLDLPVCLAQLSQNFLPFFAKG